MKHIWALFIFISFQAFALETDNFLTWNHELKDSTALLNNHIKETINEVTKAMGPTSCEAVTFAIAKQFVAKPPFVHPFEDWIMANFDEEHLFPTYKKYSYDSIYTYPLRFWLRNMPMGMNLQMNGIYFGTDKLSHFSSTGRRYLRRYLKHINAGMSEEDAKKAIIRFGLDNEMKGLGLRVAGVFSYGDMEANFQGFRFFKRLCLNDSENYLTQRQDDSWALTTAPDLSEYVSPFWDETYNLSYYFRGDWEVVRSVIKDNYCAPEILAKGQKRLAFYRTIKYPSFSLDYIRDLQASNYYRAPVPYKEQDISAICGQ